MKTVKNLIILAVLAGSLCAPISANTGFFQNIAKSFDKKAAFIAGTAAIAGVAASYGLHKYFKSFDQEDKDKLKKKFYKSAPVVIPASAGLLSLGLIGCLDYSGYWPKDAKEWSPVHHALGNMLNTIATVGASTAITSFANRILAQSIIASPAPEEQHTHTRISPTVQIQPDYIGPLPPEVEILVKYCTDENYKAQCNRMDTRPCKAILLYGEPGVGKTHLARHVAHLVNAEFIEKSANDFLSKWYGESEKQIKRLFAYANATATPSQPVIIFIDEIDILAQKRTFGHSSVGTTITTTLLTELDGFTAMNENVYVLGATNCKNPATDLDKGMMREGRFENLAYMGYPDENSRKLLLTHYFEKYPPYKVSDTNTAFQNLFATMRREDLTHNPLLNELASQTNNWSPVDLRGLVRTIARRTVTAGRDHLDLMNENTINLTRVILAEKQAAKEKKRTADRRERRQNREVHSKELNELLLDYTPRPTHR